MVKLSHPFSFFNGCINTELDIDFITTYSKILRDTVMCLGKDSFHIMGDSSGMRKVVLRPSSFHKAFEASIGEDIEEAKAFSAPTYALRTT